MAWKLGRPLITIPCHDDLAASDLIGRFLIQHNGTVWQDGPLTRAVREGAICYLDEVVEARQDTVVVLHALTDHRRMLPIDKTGETLQAAPGFQLVVSYNPGYQRMLKDLKPSTRQRFVAMDLDFPSPAVEARIVQHESGVAEPDAKALVTLAGRMRQLRDRGLAEVPSTRLLIAAGLLMMSGDRKSTRLNSSHVAIPRFPYTTLFRSPGSASSPWIWIFHRQPWKHVLCSTKVVSQSPTPRRW